MNGLNNKKQINCLSIVASDIKENNQQTFEPLKKYKYVEHVFKVNFV